MATAIAYTPVDMTQNSIWYGNITAATSNKITIKNGGLEENYYGSFTYVNGWPHGTLTGTDFSVNGVKQWSVSGLNLDAYTMAYYIQTGNATAAMNYAFSGSDSITGSSGNDVLYGAAGNDSINGDSGIDTGVYASSFSSHTITNNGSTITVSSNFDSDGTDTLSNIERLRFIDYSVAFDISGAGGQAYRVYQATFDRAPDLAGLGYWIKQMDGGMSDPEVAARFIDSAEFRSLYGTNPTTTQLVDAFYHNALHRTPDQGGLDFYVNQIDTGQKSVAQVLADLSESPENQLQVIGAIQNGIQYVPFTG